MFAPNKDCVPVKVQPPVGPNVPLLVIPAEKVLTEVPVPLNVPVIVTAPLNAFAPVLLLSLNVPVTVVVPETVTED